MLTASHHDKLETGHQLTVLMGRTITLWSDFKFAVCAVLLLTPVIARPQPPGPWALCSADPLAGLLTPDTGANPDTSPTRFTADSGEVTPQSARLRGDVVVNKGDLQLSAPDMDLDRVAGQLSAEDVRYGSPELAVQSHSARVDLDREIARFDQAEYYLAQRNAQGSADQVEVERGPRQSRLRGVTYSTCARGEEFWQLRAREMQLDQPSGRGKARDITLIIGDVPLLYLPYLSFPINDERQSGLLVPQIGYDSGSGADLTLPYYWNIAPERDATFYPRLLVKRGLMLGAEYRFITPSSHGQLQAEYLPNDRVFGDDRSAFKIEHSANPRPGLYSDLLFQYVSDDDYIKDLDDNTVGLLSPDYLERHLDVRYGTGNWTALARLQGFQPLDPTLFPPEDEPYERLPQLRLDGFGATGWQNLDYELHSELAHFAHNIKVDGTRFDIRAGLRLPLEWPAGFIRPGVEYRYTAYQLNDAAGEDSPDRSAPVVSVDSGLFLERTVDWPWLGAGTQTLEPRLDYLYVPFRNQDDIPLFDTTDIDRSYSWLFLNNRFTGADRLGDANQLTTALATRFFRNDDGREQLYAAVGQIFYFDDRRVNLEPDDPPETSNTSGPIAEAQVNFDDAVSLRGTLQWDPELDSTRRSALDLTYRPDSERLVSVSHRFAKDTLEQLDLAFIWPVDDRWRLLGRWNYSLADSRNLDLFAGFEYDDCCWALRMVARQRQELDEADTRNSVYLQVELKGLANVGRNIDNLLRDTILGYDTLNYR